MWWEMLPPLGFFSITLGMPLILLPLWQEFRTGNKFYKNTDELDVRHFWLRDMHLTGAGERPTPIDAIPDLPEDKL